MSSKVEINTKDIIDLNDENDVCRKNAADERLVLGTDVCIDAADEQRKYSIVYNGQKHSISWKTINFLDSDGKSCRSIKRKNKVNDFIVLHWTATLTAEDTIRVLKERNLGVHFIVSENGVILQLADLAEITEHCGPLGNARSIGIEIVSPYYPKFQPYCEKHLGPRPIVLDDEVHGQRLGPYLGFYDVQEEAVAQLVKVVCSVCNIPVQIPRDTEGKALKTALSAEDLKKYKGIMGHLNLTTNKIDPGGYNYNKMLKRISEI